MLEEIDEKLVVELILSCDEGVILEPLPVVVGYMFVCFRIVIHREVKQILFALFALVSDLKKSLELPHEIWVAKVFEDHRSDTRGQLCPFLKVLLGLQKVEPVVLPIKLEEFIDFSLEFSLGNTSIE